VKTEDTNGDGQLVSEVITVTFSTFLTCVFKKVKNAFLSLKHVGLERNIKH